MATVAAGSRVVGFGWDGVYVAAGEWLSRGKGYVLANRVGDQTVPTFLPGYPLIAALFWSACGKASLTIAALGLFSALCVGTVWLLRWTTLRVEYPPPLATLLVAIPAMSYGALSVGEVRMADAPYALLVAVAAALWRAPALTRRVAGRVSPA